MYSEKTSDLIQNIKNHYIIEKIRGEKTKGLVINHQSDDRVLKEIGCLTTHNDIFNSTALSTNIDFIKTKKLTNLYDIVGNYQYIAIDESQFFEDLVSFVKVMVSSGKYVHCVGLIADSDQQEMGEMLKLIPYADNVEHKKAYCVFCKNFHKGASFTKYVGGEVKKGQIHIGASQEYVPVCRTHI
jgi:thymidine kinase